MLSAVFIYLAGIEQICLNWLRDTSLFVFIVVTLTGLLLLSAIVVGFQWLSRLQQARVELQKANKKLKQKLDKQEQIEAVLRQSEPRFSNLISNIPGYFYLVANDPDYTPEFISERVYEVTGYKQEEYLIERTITCGREIHPEDRDRVWEIVQKAIEAGETYELTYRIITKSGQQKWVWEQGRSIFDETGKFLSLGGFVTDITERKQTEEELKQVKSQLELFFSQSLDGFFFMMLDEPVQWDDTIDKEKTLDYVFAHQRITKANQAILKQYGATEEQFLGLTPNDFYAHNLTYGREIWRRFFDRGRLCLETSECKLDGTPIWIEGDYVCFYDEQGKITGHFGIQRDITERKQAEEALKQLNNELELRVEQRTVDLDRTNQKLREEIAERIRAEVNLKQQKEILQTIFDNVPVMLAFYDATGQIKMANPALEQILGWSLRDLQKIDLLAECYPDPAYRQQVLDWMLKPTSGWLDVKTRIRNGQILDTSWANIRLSDGTSIGIGQDITLRKQTENSLQQAYDESRQQANQLGQINKTLQNTLEELQITQEELRQQNEELAITRERAEVERSRYQDLFDFAPDGYLVTNVAGIIKEANLGIAALVALNRSYLIDTPLAVYISAPDRPAFRNLLNQLCKQSSVQKLQTDKLSLKCGNEHSIPVSITLTAIRDAREQIVGVRWLIQDISDRVLAEKALQKSEEKFRQIAENIREIFYLSDLRQSQILYISPAYETIWGRTCQSLYEEPSSFLEAVHSQDLSLVIESLERQKKGESTRCEYRIIRPDGSVRWVWDRCFPIRDEKGELYRWCGVVEDITERREVEEQLQHDALHDTLTGLPNRTLLMDRLERLIKRNQRHKEEQFAVLFLDLDRFKVINDSWGHLVGDQLLIALARRLEQYQRASDTIARIGGDEFVILLEDITSVDDAIQVAERIQHKLMLPFILNGHEVFVSASIGITLSSEHYSQPASLLRDADSAMYGAKVRGKARHEVFDPAMHARALRQLTLENKLRQALNSPELAVYYQPIVSLETNFIEGFEALVRWNHPEQGIIYPNEFIPLAEETGLIIPLDRLVLQQACHQLRHWQEQFSTNIPLTISVNLSGKQFARPDLIEQIDRILAETRIEGQYLKLEITESVLIENAESTAEILKQLQQRKIRVCLDDFGTGYSSLSYLHRFPINSIKIDRSFVSYGNNNDSNDVIVRAIITIARELEIEVVAEGIEKVEQLAFLRSLGCHYGQGYWFSPPRDSTAIEVWLKAVGQGQLRESDGISINHN